jgi:prepilin-type N-terminal cleavage/methylation domain-containing protein
MRWTTALKNNAGMTLVELLVAVAITFIIFLGLSDAGLVVLDQNIKNSQRDEAVSVADNVMQQVRNVPVDNLVLGTTSDNVPRQIRGINQNYAVTTTVAAIDPLNAAVGRQVTVNVAWSRNERGLPVGYNHQIMTIVRQR